MLAPAASAAILTTWQPQLKKNFHLLPFPTRGSISYWLSLGHLPVSESVTLTDLSDLSHSHSGSGGRVSPEDIMWAASEEGRKPHSDPPGAPAHGIALTPPACVSLCNPLSLSELPHYSASLTTSPPPFPSYLPSCLSAFFPPHLTPPAFPFRLILAKVGEHLSF